MVYPGGCPPSTIGWDDCRTTPYLVYTVRACMQTKTHRHHSIIQSVASVTSQLHLRHPRCRPDDNLGARHQGVQTQHNTRGAVRRPIFTRRNQSETSLKRLKLLQHRRASQRRLPARRRPRRWPSPPPNQPPHRRRDRVFRVSPRRP